MAFDHMKLSAIYLAAEHADIDLEWRGPLWVATDRTTGEQASGRSIPRAWASLRDRDPSVIHDQLLFETTKETYARE